MLYVNFFDKRLKFAPKWSISYFHSILAAIFVTIATVKVKIIPDLYTWAIVLINYKLIRRIRLKHFDFLASNGRQNSLLMHIALFLIKMFYNKLISAFSGKLVIHCRTVY